MIARMTQTLNSPESRLIGDTMGAVALFVALFAGLLLTGT